MISSINRNSSPGLFAKILFVLFFFHVPPIAAGPLDLASLQVMALRNNPKIKALEGEARMAEHRIEQSRSLEDLKLTFGVNSLPLDTFSFNDEAMTSKEIGVSQMIPLWGKRSIRVRIAELERLIRLEALRQERIRVLHMLRQSVYEMRGAILSKEILKEIQIQIGLLIDSETALTKTGMGTLSGVINANIESIMVDEKECDLDQRIESLRARIAYLAGIEIKAPPSLPSLMKKEVSEEAVKESVKESPEMKIASYGTLMSREKMRLREKEFLPDMEAGVAYMQRNDTASSKRADMVSAMVSFNMPVWVKAKREGVAEALYQTEAMEQWSVETLNDLDQKGVTLRAEMEKWWKIYELYRRRSIPQAELEFRSTLAAYRVGGPLAPVIEKLKRLLSFQNECVNAETAYRTSVSGLSALMGIEVLQ